MELGETAGEAAPPAEQTTAMRRLVLVRHGETVGQSSIRYYGRTDVALSDLGRRQMERVGAALAGEAFDAVYTSPLQRALASARLVAPGIEPQAIAGFAEVNFGRWEGLTREEIEALEPDLYRRWRVADVDFIYPDGDAVAGFRARVINAFRTLLPSAPEHLLIVVHTGVIRTILSELLRLPNPDGAAWRIDLASIHVVAAASDRRGWRLEIMNDTRHLEGIS